MTESNFTPLRPAAPPCLVVYSYGAYLNGAATRLVKAYGEYVELELDPERQAVRFVPRDGRGPGRLHLTYDLGNPLSVRRRLLRVGMSLGRYIHTGDGVFRHINHLSIANGNDKAGNEGEAGFAALHGVPRVRGGD